MPQGAPQPIQGVVVQGSPVHRPGAGAAAGAAVGAAVGAVGASGGFMNTAAPTGVSWANFCQQHEVVVDPSTGMISGPWGECLAWAVAYEKQNPGWHQDPRLHQHQQMSKSLFQMHPYVHFPCGHTLYNHIHHSYSILFFLHAHIMHM